jgi:hypothetical protein
MSVATAQSLRAGGLRLPGGPDFHLMLKLRRTLQALSKVGIGLQQNLIQRTFMT